MKNIFILFLITIISSHESCILQSVQKKPINRNNKGDNKYDTHNKKKNQLDL